MISMVRKARCHPLMLLALTFISREKVLRHFVAILGVRMIFFLLFWGFQVRLEDSGDERSWWSRRRWHEGSRFSSGMFGDDIFGSFGEGGGSMHQSALKRAPPLENKLPCSLEDLYKRTTKRTKISRGIIDAAGFNNVVHPTYEEVVPREGMAIQKDPLRKGLEG